MDSFLSSSSGSAEERLWWAAGSQRLRRSHPSDVSPFVEYKPPARDSISVPPHVLYVSVGLVLVVVATYAIVGHLIDDLLRDLADPCLVMCTTFFLTVRLGRFCDLRILCEWKTGSLALKLKPAMPRSVLKRRGFGRRKSEPVRCRDSTPASEIISPAFITSHHYESTYSLCQPSLFWL
ncbi:hypothetical protein QQF64_015772 [Cirrhinus molitorella]|uniref:Uncharacterized protein n=1 Tax=Cirrhinus molitorella TaxID=172907 RepID=A0ABR3NWL2_9TELE